MQEKIILVPGGNGTEMIRSLAKFGQNNIGLRVENAVGLSRLALMRSGISVEEAFITRGEEPSIYNGFINKIKYFASASYADCEKIAQAVFSIRSLISDDEENQINTIFAKGEFQAKNEAIIETYKLYIDALQENKLIDSIGIIRKTIAEAKALSGECFTLKEYPLSTIEKALIGKMSNGQYKEISLSELFGREDASDYPKEIAMTEAYGSTNEIEDVLAYIYKNNIPLDQCVVATAGGTAHAQLFYDYSKQYGIPVTFGNGIPISNTNPAILLGLLNKWDTSGFNGVNALRELINSSAFDRQKLVDGGIEFAKLVKAIPMAGQLRISYDNAENTKRIKAYRESLEKEKALNADTLEVLEVVEKLASEFSRGCTYMLKKYSIIRDGITGRADRAALSVITDTIEAFTKFSDGNISEIIPDILNKTVCSEISREGELFVTSIKGAMNSIRPYLFIAGMSASNFPGKPSENYLVLDSDYMLFEEGKRFTSTERIHEKKEELDNLLKVAATLGVQVRMSFSGYNLAGHAEDNPSSALYEIYCSLNPSATMESFKKQLRHIGFFENNISGLEGLGRAYNNNTTGEPDMDIPEEEILMADADKPWSPSALEIFFQCPRRFYLTRILGVKEPEDDDPFTVINANQVGTLAHSQMEHLAEKRVDREEFLDRAGREFDEFLLSRPPIHPDAVTKEKETFIKMMANAYDTDPDNEVLSAEEEWTVTHECGIKIHGYPDRIEKIDEDNCIIADYKTKRNIDHVEDDVDTCLQVLLYAYMAQRNGIPVTSGEYRYIRLKENVKCRFDEDMKEKLANKLEIFKNALDTGIFPCNPGKKEVNCKYCKCMDVCGKNNVSQKGAE